MRRSALSRGRARAAARSISPAAIGVAKTGTVELAQRVGQRADVVLVPVRDDEAAEAVAELAQIVELGDDEIDAEHARVGKHHPAVDGDRLAGVLEHQAVEADLAETAERHDAQRIVSLRTLRASMYAARWRLREVRAESTEVMR